MFIDDEYLTQFAVYPKITKRPVYSYLNFKSPKSMQHANYHFFLDSSISEDEISQIVIRFKIEKPKNSKLKISSSEIFRYI